MTESIGNPSPNLALLYRPRRNFVRGERRRASLPARFRMVRGPYPSFARATHPESLLDTLKRLRRENGQAPGVDGLRYDALSTTEAAQIFRVVSEAILAGSYVPQPTRPVRIPKRGGHRTLQLQTIVDRVVAAAVADELEPHIEEINLPMSFGFRPRRNAWQMLLAMTACMQRYGLWVVGQDDIEQAFDNVPIDPLMQLVRGHVSDGRLANLVETIVRGAERHECRIGIRQGCPLSPELLNLYLTECLDRPLPAADPTHPPLFRYADNLAWTAGSETDGAAANQRIAASLASGGLRLKGMDGPPIDLRRQGARVHLLGYTLRRQDEQVVIDFGPRVWSKLRDALTKALRMPNPAQAVRKAITGWIAANTLAISSDSVDRLTDRIYAESARVGICELGPRRVYQTLLDEAAQTGHALRQVADETPVTATYMQICSSIYDHTLRVCTAVPAAGRMLAAGGYAAVSRE